MMGLNEPAEFLANAKAVGVAIVVPSAGLELQTIELSSRPAIRPA